MLALYHNGGHKAKSLDELRFLTATASKVTAVERMPPTSRSWYFNCLRVHHQISTWRNLRTVLPLEECGFSKESGSVCPIYDL